MAGEMMAVALQEPQAAPQQAAQQAQRELQQAQREVQQAQREAQQAQRQAQLEAQQAQREAQQAARQAQIEAQQAVREAQDAIRQAAREGRPGVAFPPFPPSGPQIPEGAVMISIAFFIMCAVIAIGLPIARAIARRSDRRGAVSPAGDADTRARLERIEQAVDAIAVEVERISEGQRFTTKIMSEFRALPQPDPAAALGDRGTPDGAAVPVSRARESR